MREQGITPDEQDLGFTLPDWLEHAPDPSGDPGFMVFSDDRLNEGQNSRPDPFEGNGGTPRRRHVYKSSEWVRVSPRVFRCRVTVASDAGEFTGEADGPEVPGIRAEISARATIEALNHAEGDIVLALKGARVLRVFESPMVVVGMYALNAGETASLVGACMVHNSVEQAAIQATLQAADRWLTWQAHHKQR